MILLLLLFIMAPMIVTVSQCLPELHILVVPVLVRLQCTPKHCNNESSSTISELPISILSILIKILILSSLLYYIILHYTILHIVYMLLHSAWSVRRSNIP